MILDITKNVCKCTKINSIRDMLISGLRNTNAAIIAENDEFLNTATVGNVPIMQYWKNATKYPALQKMAMDYLGIPASTVQIESENSKAK